MRLISSDRPCAVISAKPSGISSFTGQRSNPPGEEDVSPRIQESRKKGQVIQASSAIAGSTNRVSPITSIQIRARSDSQP